MDKLYIKKLEVETIIGIREKEREIPQRIRIDIELSADLRKPCANDDIEETVDYSLVHKKVKQKAETGRFFLIEKLAEEIADLCLHTDNVQKVKVRVEKPDVYDDTESVGVEIEREA